MTPSREPAEMLRSAEFWLKVAVHIAGFAALLATPTVAALLTHLRNEICLLP
jgi:hypothetical protein